ncbi:phage tail spike protein [Paenibacillus sp. B1-33]|uniref:phage tail spike protein n=1 Tax=unclassified Paenibacillus TaxID=185978 RepID=UPI003D2A2B41
MLRLGDIDFAKKPVAPQLFLCKPNKETISKLAEAHNIVFNLKLGALNELTFDFPAYLDKHHIVARNKNFELIKGRYLIKLVLGSYEEYFIVNQIGKRAGDDGESVSVSTLSLGYELNDKIIRDYKAVSKTATELMKDVLIESIWQVGYVDSEFELKRRGLEVSSNTVLEVIFDIAKTFNAVVVWDTLHRTVSLKKPDFIGHDKGFSIKYGKYLESVNQEDNAEEIVTRLKMYGKEDITIREINPTGTSFVEDFHYFIYPYKEDRNYSQQYYYGPDMKAQWNHHDAEWSVLNGKLISTSNLQQLSTIVNSSAFGSQNYKLSATLNATGGDNVMGFVVRYQDDRNYYWIGWESGKIQGGVGWGKEKLRLYKRENGNDILLALTDAVDGWSTDVHYRMAVEVYNQDIKIWIDDRLVLSGHDSTYSHGAYGLISINQPFEVEYVEFMSKEHTVLSHSDYMTDALCHGLLEYEDLLQGNRDAFTELVAKREANNSILHIKNEELHQLNTQLKMLLDERDTLNTRIAKLSDEIDHADNTFQDYTLLLSDLNSLQNELDAKLIEIKAKESEISRKEVEVTQIEQQHQEIMNHINALKLRLDIRNNFTKKLLDERNQYIIEKEWQNSNIEDPNDLLKEGMKAFDELKQQKITLKVDLVNFLSMVTEQRNWDKLGLGDTIGIEHERISLRYKAKITEIEYNFEDKGINLTISNMKDMYANKDKFIEMLYKSYNTSTQVSIDSWKWDLSMQNNGAINQIINNNWDANKNAIIGAKDQVVELSDRGLIIRDPKNPLHYLVGLNSMIAITNDGGNTWKHALTADGIVGERIYGKVIMGVNLAIEDESGVLKFQGSKGEIFDRNGKLVMKLGLVEENPDAFGLMSFNDITRVKVTDKEGFVIDKANSKRPDGWEKVMWADQRDGTLYTHGLVAENIKVFNDIGKMIMDAESNYFNIGDFKTIVMDSKLTSLEKMQIITELYKLEAGYHRMLEQAKKYKRSQRDDDFDMNAQFFTKVPSTKDLYSTESLTQAYQKLIAYMSQYIKITSVEPLNIAIHDPLTEKTSEIADRSEFILAFKTYYDEEKNLRNKIQDAQFYSGLNMGKFYNNVVIGEYGFIALRNDGKYRAVLNATNGLALQKWEKNKWSNKVYAAVGSSEYTDGTLIAEDLVAKRLRIETKVGNVLLDADALNLDFTVLDSIILDDVIVSPEKITLANQFKIVTKQYNELKSQINRYAMTIYNDRESSYAELDEAQSKLVAASNELEDSYNRLKSYMQPIFANMNTTTHLIHDLGSTRTEFHEKWENFYQEYEYGRVVLADFLEKSSLQLGRDYNNTLIDAENGIVVTRGDNMYRTVLNATDGIKIEKNIGTGSSPNWDKRFYVDTDGKLLAVELKTKALKILDGELGEKIILDAEKGITINGARGEVIRLNANEGIAIDVNDKKRFWIHKDGTLRARKLIIESDEGKELVLDKETSGYISNLMVNSLKTAEKPEGDQDYVFIKDQFIKLLTGDTSNKDVQKFKLHLNTDENDSYPEMIWGQGSGQGNQGIIKKTAKGFFFEGSTDIGDKRMIQLLNRQVDAIVVKAEKGKIKIDSDTEIELVCGKSVISIKPNAIQLHADRIDLN